MCTIFKSNPTSIVLAPKITTEDARGSKFWPDASSFRDTKLEKKGNKIRFTITKLSNFIQKQHPIMILATDKMTTLVEENDTKRQESSPPPSQQGEVPSGFILKLFQMVNGAPDEVIAVGSTFFFAFRNECASNVFPLCSFDFLVVSICMHTLCDRETSLDILFLNLISSSKNRFSSDQHLFFDGGQKRSVGGEAKVNP
jgi:hypothetical protein